MIFEIQCVARESLRVLLFLTLYLHKKSPKLITPQDSEITYLYSCILLIAIPIIVAGAGYATVKLQNSKRRKLKIREEELANGRSGDKMVVKEWLHQVKGFKKIGKMGSGS